MLLKSNNGNIIKKKAQVLNAVKCLVWLVYYYMCYDLIVIAPTWMQKQEFAVVAGWGGVHFEIFV